MAFCTTCGSQIAGRFCEKCGAPAPGSSGSVAAAAAPAPFQQTVPPTPPAATRKGIHPIIWILGGLFAIGILFVGALTIGGILLVHKAKEAGLDPALWEKNPGLAATKVLAAANPDAQIMSVDEGAGVIVVRDRKTGKTIRMNFADIKSGRMSLEADGEKVNIAAVGNGDNGALEIQSKDGTARFAAGSTVKLPAWVPAYAGAKETGGFSTNGPRGDAGTYGFKTSDTPAQVIAFYESALKSAGFTIQSKLDAGSTTVLSADNAAHSVQVGAGADRGETGVSISFSSK